jgi:hypothetical protein
LHRFRGWVLESRADGYAAVESASAAKVVDVRTFRLVMSFAYGGMPDQLSIRDGYLVKDAYPATIEVFRLDRGADTVHGPNWALAGAQFPDPAVYALPTARTIRPPNRAASAGPDPGG